MDTVRLVTVTLALLLAAVAVLGVVIVTGRLLRRLRTRRDARIAAEVRPLLLRLTAGDEDDVDEPLRRLAAMDRRRWLVVQASAVSLLGKVSGQGNAALARLFQERGAARSALADLSRRGAVRRARAANVLGLLHHAEAVGALVGLLTDRHPEVRTSAARALGRIGEPQAAAPLLRSLSGGRIPSDVVAQALIRIGPAARPALAKAMAHPDPAVRAIAAEVLGVIGSVGSVAALIRALTMDPSTEVRARAAASLGRLGTPACLDALAGATSLIHPTAVRAEAASALGDIGAAGGVPALRGLLADHHYRVAHNAARSLTRLGGPARDVLEEAAAGTMGKRAAGHAKEALAVLDLAEGRPLRPAAAP
ncbi:HEAT repeat domain-containing protein [Planomonospora corallina]|uniref:HEAT repeat domain-containing protein n=1 Tax=Planomonospora corallina TaxID=1806052 RepID=A0ABV8IEH8_9ACTN